MKNCRTTATNSRFRRCGTTKIGDKIRFIPSAWTQFGDTNSLSSYGVKGDVEGEIVEINYAHRWYRARYQAGGATLYESFKF